MYGLYIALGMTICSALITDGGLALQLFPLVQAQLGKGPNDIQIPWEPAFQDGCSTLFSWYEQGGETLVMYVQYDPAKDSYVDQRDPLSFGQDILDYRYEQRCRCSYDCCAHYNGGLRRAWEAEDGKWYGIVRLNQNI